MIDTTNVSGSYENDVSEPDPIETLVNEICIVWASGQSFCARLTSIRDSDELWFESKSKVRWMVKRQAVTGIRPLHCPPGGR